MPYINSHRTNNSAAHSLDRTILQTAFHCACLQVNGLDRAIVRALEGPSNGGMMGEAALMETALTDDQVQSIDDTGVAALLVDWTKAALRTCAGFSTE
jgi:hypothetical protein